MNLRFLKCFAAMGLAAFFLSPSSVFARPAAVELLGEAVLAPGGTLEFRFARPMVARDALGPAAASPIVFEPELAGGFVWLSTASGVFLPSGPLPLGKTWKIQTRTGLADAEGKPFGPFTIGAVSTPPFQITALSSTAWGTDNVPSRVMARVAFNLPVNLDSATKAFRFVNDERALIPATVRFANTNDYFPLPPEAGDWSERFEKSKNPESAPGGPDVVDFPARLMVSPESPLPPGNGWRLEISSGILSASGAAKTTGDSMLELGTVQPLRLDSIQTVHFINTGTAATARFNLPLAPDITEETADKFFKISPAPGNLTWESGWEGLTVRGDFEVGKEYTLHIGDDVVADDGRVFVGPREAAFSFEPVAPRIYLPEISAQQLQSGRRVFPARFINLSSLNLDAKQIAAEDLPRALSAFAAYRKTEWDAENPDEQFQPVDPAAIPGRPLLRAPMETGNPGMDRAGEVEIDWNSLLGPGKSGSVFLTLQGEPLRNVGKKKPGAQALVQVTDLGVLWKWGSAGLNARVFSMKSGTPVPDASLALFDAEFLPLGSTKTGADGAATLSKTAAEPAWMLLKTDSDAHAISLGLNAEILPVWGFGVPVAFSPWTGDPSPGDSIRAVLFTDRPLYKPGETAHVKGILRVAQGAGLALPESVDGTLALFGPRGELIETREIKSGPAGDFDADWPLPSSGRGEYRIAYRPEAGPFEWWQASASIPLLVADFQPDAFEIGLQLPDAGKGGTARMSANYLFGGRVENASAQWTLQTSRAPFQPDGMDDFNFFETSPASLEVPARSGRLEVNGEASIPLELSKPKFAPLEETLTVEVTDLNQQTVTASKTLRTDSSDFYLGIAPAGRRLISSNSTLPVKVVAVGTNGSPLDQPVAAKAELFFKRNQIVRMRGAGGAITFDRSSTLEPAGKADIRTLQPIRENDRWSVDSAQPATEFPLPSAGEYVLRVTATDSSGREVLSERMFWVAGPGETVWDFRNASQMDIVADKDSYAPGETAKLLLKSPIQGRAYVSVERGGSILRSFTQEIDGNAPVIEIPVDAGDSPNVYVSVVVVRGADASKRKFPEPDFRYGLKNLTVRSPEEELVVKIEPAKLEYMPGETIRAAVAVNGSDGRPVPGANVTFFAVDDGILSITGYERPDPLPVFRAPIPLGVRTGITLDSLLPENPEDLRFENKGYLIGGGGIGTAGLKLREDFPGTIAWFPSLKTGADGKVSVEFPAPDAITRYRLIAVVHAGASRFGSAENAVRIAKPLSLLSGAGAFANKGDTLLLRAVLRNETGRDGRAEVALSVPEGASLLDAAPTSVDIANGRSAALEARVRFEQTGAMVFKWSAAMGSENARFSDALAVTIDVGSPAPVLRETYLPELASEKNDLLDGVNPQLREGVGSVHVTIANSRLAGIGESAAYVLEYPYGCAEQTVSSLVPWLARGLVQLLPALDRPPADVRNAIDSGITRIFSMQTSSGGIAFWPGQDTASEFVSAYAAMVLAKAPAAGGMLPGDATSALLGYLSRQLREPLPKADPSSMINRSLALYALALHNKPEPAYHEQLLSMGGILPADARCFLALAIKASGGSGEALQSARGLLSAKPPESGVYSPFAGEERSRALKALALAVLAPTSKDFAPTLAELLQSRKNGRWNNTQSNAWALLALEEYFVRVEAGGKAAAKPAKGVLVAEESRKDFTLDSKTRAVSERVAFDGKTGTPALEVLNPSKRQWYGRLTFEIEPPLADQPAQSRGFTISRAFQKIAPDGSLSPAENLRVGDRVIVTLRVEAARPSAFVAVEDFSPAIFEPVNPDFISRGGNSSRAEGSSWISHREMLADRVRFFCDELPAGEHIFQYLARVRMAGTATAPAPKVEEMYRPENFGLGLRTEMTSLPSD